MDEEGSLSNAVVLSKSLPLFVYFYPQRIDTPDKS
jgi:hypothetical protein